MRVISKNLTNEDVISFMGLSEDAKFDIYPKEIIRNVRYTNQF